MSGLTGMAAQGLALGLALGLAVGLAGCVAKTGGLPEGNYRPNGGQIYSSAVFDPAKLPGRWQQVAGFGAKDCAPGAVDIRPGGQVSYRLCLAGREVKGTGKLAATGPGRFALAGQDWWVLWADGDYRTMAIGTPSGKFGFILNRGGAISADRMRAAREIFEWNGYDLAAFQPI